MMTANRNEELPVLCFFRLKKYALMKLLKLQGTFTNIGSANES